MTLRTYDPNAVAVEFVGRRPHFDARVTFTLTDDANEALRAALLAEPSETRTPFAIRGTPVAEGLRPRRKRKALQEAQARLVGVPVSKYRRGLLVYLADVVVTPVHDSWEVVGKAVEP